MVHQFLSDWHGVSFWLFPGLLPEAHVEVASHAAGSISYGEYLRGLWFAGFWAPESQQQKSIAYREQFPVVIAAHVRGHMCCKKHALFRSRSSKVPSLFDVITAQPASCSRSSLIFPFLHNMYLGLTIR